MKRMAGILDSKDPGFCQMNKGVKFGVPRAKMSGKSGSISSADSRGKDCPKMKK